MVRISRRAFLAGAAASVAIAAASRPGTLDLAPNRPRAPDATPVAPGRFLVGANYEGPADRAWAMWEPERFDRNLIDADFGRARDAGLSTLRIFVQQSLAKQILAGDWSAMDEVMTRAERRGLGLLVSLADYPEERLNQRADVAGRVASRYARAAGVRGYDLENEPRPGDLVTALYPGGVIPLQSDAAIRAYGEAIPSASALAWRASQPLWLPARFTDTEAYWVINTLLFIDVLMDEAKRWTSRSPGSTILEFLDEPEPRQKWQPLLDLLDDALARWIDVQAWAIRNADPTLPITIGYNDLLLSALPANRALDFVSFHHYLPADDSAPDYAVTVASSIGERVGRPVLLGEFGWSTHEVDPARAAELESATFQAASRAGLAGGLKWMLNDASNQPDPREASFGLFRSDGSAKPSVMALRELGLA